MNARLPHVLQPRRLVLAATCCLILGWTGPSTAQVIFDQSTPLPGPAGRSGTLIEIPQSRGTSRGPNVFHSFEQFDIARGESAVFFSDPAVERVIARVTGAGGSLIDGEIGVGNPVDLFLIDPGGITFGPGAILPAGPGFFASTAHRLRLGGGVDVRTDAPDAIPLLATQGIEAFGFIDADAAPLVVDGSRLFFQAAGQTLGLLGGDLEIRGLAASGESGGGFVSARAGRILLGSAAPGDELALLPGADERPASVELRGRGGSIALIDDAIVSASASDPDLGTVSQGVGSIRVRAHQMRIVDSDLRALRVGAGLSEPGRIDISLAGELWIEHVARSDAAGGFRASGIFARKLAELGGIRGDGDAAAIDIRAGSLRLLGGARISSTTEDGGLGGAITLDVADDLLIRGGIAETPGGIYSSAEGTGAAGTIDARAGSLIMEQRGVIVAQTELLRDGPGPSGIAGTIALDVGTAIVRGDARIDSSSGPGGGGAGTIELVARESVLLTGSSGQGAFSGVSAIAKPGSLGAPGVISVSAPVVEIRDGARITTEAAGGASGARVQLAARDRIELLGGARVEASATGELDGGEVDLRAGTMLRIDGSSVSASVVDGDGGNVTVDPRFVILRNGEIVARAQGGDGGNIDITADFLLASQSSIDASSRFGVDGQVVLRSPDVDVAGSIEAPSASFVDPDALLRDHCAARARRARSSFVYSGPAAAPEGAEQLPAATYRRSAGGAADDPLAGVHERIARGDLHEAARRLDALPGGADALALRARIARRSGDTAGALGLLDRADAAAAESSTRARIALDRGALLADLGRDPEADEVWEQALGSCGPDEMLCAKLRLARTGLLEPRERARELVAIAADLAARPASGEVLRVELYTALQLARAAALLDDEPLRMGTGERLVSIASRAGAEGAARVESGAWGHLAVMYEVAGRHREALILARRALRAAGRAGATALEGRWQHLVGRQLAASGELDAAIEALMPALHALQSLRLPPPAYSRAEGLHPAGVLTDLVDALLRRAAITEDPVERASWLVRARTRLEDFNLSELDDYFGDECVTASRRRPLESVPGTLIVHPVVLPDRIELVISDGDGIRSIAVQVPASRVEEVARAFRRHLQQPESRRYLREAWQLHDWLVQPLADQLPDAGGTLVVVPFGPLRGIPFAALQDRESGRFLVERLAVAVAPGLALTDLRALDRTHARTLRAGLTRPVQGFRPLPHVAEELAAIGSTFGGASLVDGAFVRDAFTAAVESEPWGIVHIASHARIAGREEEAFLLTWDDRLGMQDLAELLRATDVRPVPLELLTLSACETAVGDGRAALGLAGTAVRAGARSTLATLWTIDDRASARLVSRFYTHLSTPGISRAESLRRAQLELLDDGRLGHPVYWSAFVLIGSWL